MAQLSNLFCTAATGIGSLQSPTSKPINLDALLECGTLISVVEIKFVRECYIISSVGRSSEDKGEGCREEGKGECGDQEEGKGEAVRVDLDECGGYRVGEVEIMVSFPHQMQAAAKKCRAIATQLGVTLYVTHFTVIGPRLSYPFSYEI